MKGDIKKVIEAPHQISVENFSTIEGTKKYLMQHPLKTELKSPLLLKGEKNKKFYQIGTQTLCDFPVLLEEH